MDPLAPQNLLASWLAALAALPLAVVTGALGQGLGAVAGHCTWIGLTLPLHRQPWALVNEPTLNFASTSAATGYWLGALVLPAILAVAIVSFLPRSKTVWAEVAAVQTAFGMAVGGLGWLPLLDPVDGHLARWLDLQDLPSFLLAVPPIIGSAAALPAVLRMLAFDRAAHRSSGVFRRMAVTLLCFLPPTALWIGLGSAAAGHLPALPAAGAALPLVTALLASAVFTVEPWVLPLEPNRLGTVVLLVVTAVVLGGLLYVGGRPLSRNRASGILWARPNAFNNVRPWVVPVELYRHAVTSSQKDLVTRNQFE